MLLSQHKTVIENFYITLAHSSYQKASPDAYREIVLEVHNTKATLLSLLNSNYEDEFTLIKASIRFTSFCSSIGDHSDKVISQAVEFVKKNSGVRPLLIQCLVEWGDLCFFANIFEKAKEKLQEAEKYCLFSQNINSDLYGNVLKKIGAIHERQDALSDAEFCYGKSLGLFKDSNNITQQGYIYSALGNLCRRQMKLDEAAALYQSAIQCYKNTIGCPLLQSKTHRGLGRTYLLQN